MSVDKLVKRIRTDAKRKAKIIAKRARDKAESEKEKIISEKERKLDELKKESDRELRTLKNRIRSQAKLDARKRELEVREEMIDEIFQEALKKLGSLQAEDYKVYIRQAIGKCVKVLGKDITVSCNEESKELVSEMAKKIAPSVKVKADLISVGGIKARSESGSFIDLTFESNLERMKKDIRKEISEMMFKEEI